MSGTEGLSSDLARALVAEIPFGMVVLAPIRDDSGTVIDTRFVFVNTAATALLGYPPGALPGVVMSTLGSPRGGAFATALVGRVLASGDPVVDVVPTRMGMIRVMARPVDGMVMLVARDAPGEDTAAAVEQLRELLESASDNVAMLEPIRDARGEIDDFTCTFFNDQGLRALDLPIVSAGQMGVPLRALVPGYPDELIEGYRTVMRTGVPFVKEVEFTTRRGQITLHVVATRYQQGVMVATRDTTPQTVAQRELARSEERFRSTVETMTDAVGVLRSVRDRTGAIVDFSLEFVNASAVALLDGGGDVRGRSLLEVRPQIAELGVIERLARVVDTGEADFLEIPWIRADGVGAVEASLVRLGDGVVAVGRDITDRQRHQRQVEESERRFHLLAENAGDAVFYGTIKGLLWVSPSVEPLLGFRPEELVGRPPVSMIHPDDAHIVLNARSSYSPGTSTRARFRVLRKDGSSLWVESMVRLLSDDPLDQALIVSTFWSVQAEVEAQAALRRAEEERRVSEARYNQAARLESLGVMAGGIAHDFNNLLVGVLGNAELALMELPADAPARARVERITLAAQRAADLTRQLLDYTGSRSGPLDVVDVTALVLETRDLVAARLPSSTVLRCETDGHVAAVRGDRGQLQQVLMNLVINASDALGGRDGLVSVSVRTDDAGPALSEGLQPGRFVVISVTDDGPGMSAETLQRVFEPFFTTKPTGRGLGLAVVHGVVRAHLGTVMASSTVGLGTTMSVYLPATTDVPASGADNETPVTSAAGSPWVLVVDDDDGVREVSTAILESAGMRVRPERDGRSALDEFVQHPDRYAAVLLDLTMPGMSGDEVLQALRGIDAEVPVVIISGYSDADVHGRLSQLSIDGFVKKPFRPAELVDTVRQALRTQHGPSA